MFSSFRISKKTIFPKENLGFPVSGFRKTNISSGKPMFSSLRASKNQYFLRKTNVFHLQGSEKQIFPKENQSFPASGLRKKQIFPKENQCFPASRNFKQPHMLDCIILLSLRGAKRNRNLEIRRGTIFEISLFEPLHVFVRSSFLCILAFSSTGYPMGSQTGYHIQIQIHL